MSAVIYTFAAEDRDRIIMEDAIFEEFEVLRFSRGRKGISREKAPKKAISEISLKIYVNETEAASLLCLNRQQEELAVGFLFNEGVIRSFDEIAEIYYNEPVTAVVIKLNDGITVKRLESLRSVTSGCGKCYTYINPLKQNQYTRCESDAKFDISDLLDMMEAFVTRSEIFKQVGGVHSLLFHSPGFSVFSEDIGRHNCFDKAAGTILKENKTEAVKNGVVFISGRISSEIMTKAIRLGVPALVSKSTPTSSAVRLAEQYNITLLGYTRGDSGYIYSGAHRISGFEL